MDIKILSTVFTAILIAELGDKTQLATLLFATNQDVSKLAVFLGASAALIVASAIGVLAGGMLANVLDPRILRYVAGAGFIAIGVWTILAS